MRRYVFENEINNLGTVIESIDHPGPGWLECDGKSYHRADYPQLANLRPEPGLKFSTRYLSDQFSQAPAWRWSNIMATDTTLFQTFGTSGKYFRSTDGGVTWDFHSTPFNLRYRSIHKLTTGRLILTSGREGPPIYSDDDGLTWTSSLNIPVLPPFCIYGVVHDVLYMMKQGDTNIYRTTDLINWTTIPINLTNWNGDSKHLWTSFLVLHQEGANSNYFDLMVTISDSEIGLDLYTTNSGVTFTTYEQPLKSNYVYPYQIPQKNPSIIKEVDGWTYHKCFYLDIATGSVNVFDEWLYTIRSLTIVNNPVTDTDVLIADNKIIVFDYKSPFMTPYVSYDGDNFNNNYGALIPALQGTATVFNNKIYYFSDQDNDDKSETLVVVEFDSSLFSVPGITPKGDLKFYISTGQ